MVRRVYSPAVAVVDHRSNLDRHRHNHRHGNNRLCYRPRLHNSNQIVDSDVVGVDNRLRNAAGGPVCCNHDHLDSIRFHLSISGHGQFQRIRKRMAMKTMFGAGGVVEIAVYTFSAQFGGCYFSTLM